MTSAGERVTQTGPHCHCAKLHTTPLIRRGSSLQMSALLHLHTTAAEHVRLPSKYRLAVSNHLSPVCGPTPLLCPYANEQQHPSPGDTAHAVRKVKRCTQSPADSRAPRSPSPQNAPRRLGWGQKGLAARWGLQLHLHVWVCAVTRDQPSE